MGLNVKRYRRTCAVFLSAVMLVSSGSVSAAREGSVRVSANENVSQGVTIVDEDTSITSSMFDDEGQYVDAMITDDVDAYNDSENQIIVQYRDKYDGDDMLTDYGEVSSVIDDYTVVYQINSSTEVESALDVLKDNYEDISIVQPNYKVTVSGVATTQSSSSSTDYYAQGAQWGLENDGTFTGTNSSANDYNIQAVADMDIDAEDAWNEIATVTGSAVSSPIVAVIDTGVDYDHEDLSDVVWSNSDETSARNDADCNGYTADIRGWNFVSNSSNVNDDNGHGTHVAGIIAAEDNNTGVRGVASGTDVQIMPIKAFDSSGSADTSAIIKAIQYAENNGATICNCSWGYEASNANSSNDALLQQQMNNSDMLFIVAAGNDAENVETTTCVPVSFNSSNIIGVASNEWDGSISWFSNYGTTSVDISAPGGDIISTLPNDKYGYEWGTSMATPFVTGVAALVQIASGSTDAEYIRNIILNSNNVTSVSSLSSYCQTGGITNAGAAVQMAIEDAGTGTLVGSTSTSSPSTSSPAATATSGTTQNSGSPSFPSGGDRSGGWMRPGSTYMPNGSQTTSTPSVETTVSPTTTQNPSATQSAQTTDAPDVTNTTTPTTTSTPGSIATSGAVNSSDDETDVTSPVVKLKISSAGKYAKKLKISVTDTSLSDVRYVAGKKTMSYFDGTTSGESVTVSDGSAVKTLKVTKPGWYTIYAEDSYGNTTLKRIFVKVKVVKLTRSSMSLQVGDAATLRAYLLKKQYVTGKIYFKSTNTSVVTVNKKSGRLKAVSKGSATVIAYTPGGKTAICQISIK